jgi:hypothetical protein
MAAGAEIDISRSVDVVREAADVVAAVTILVYSYHAKEHNP